MSLHERRNVAVLSAGQQITFPMTRNGLVFGFRRSFANGNGVDDPAVPVNAGVPGAAHPPPRSQVVHQLFLQYATSLNESPSKETVTEHSSLEPMSSPGRTERVPARNDGQQVLTSDCQLTALPRRPFFRYFAMESIDLNCERSCNNQEIVLGNIRRNLN